MGAISDAFAEAWRNYVSENVPASGEHEPIKAEIRTIGTLIESAIDNATFAGLASVLKSTRALLNADLAHIADTVALVYADATDANNDLYIKVGGSGTGSWTLTTILHDLAQPREIVRGVASTAGYSNNDFEFTPLDPTFVFTGDGTQYELEFEAPSSNSAGSGGVSVDINHGSGALFASMSLLDKDNAALAPGAYDEGDLMTVRRMSAGEDASQRLRWIRPTDSSKAVARWLGDTGAFAKPVSTVRPFRYLKRDAYLHYYTMRWDEDFYAGGQSRRASDQIRVVEFDQVNYAGLSSGHSLSLNSIETIARARVCNDLNMQMTVVEGGILPETGLSPTAIEPPIHGGDAAEAEANSEVSGVTHNNYIEPETVLTLTQNDITTGNVDDEVVIDPGASIGTQRYGDKLVKTLTFLCTEETAEVYCRATYTVTYDPAATDQIRIQSEFDFTDGDITVTTPGMIRGFAMVAAFTDIDRCQAIVNGVAGAVQTIDTRNDASITLGFPEAVYFWHSDFPEKQILVTNNAGYGYTHWEDGTDPGDRVANTSTQTYVASFAGGPYVKLYGGLYGDQSGSPVWTNMTGKVIYSDCSIRFLFAAART